MSFLAEGAWERPGLPALLACFSWGPWGRGKNPDSSSRSGPAQGECVAFLDSWILRGGGVGVTVRCTQGPEGWSGPTSRKAGSSRVGWGGGSSPRSLRLRKAVWAGPQGRCQTCLVGHLEPKALFPALPHPCTPAPSPQGSWEVPQSK